MTHSLSPEDARAYFPRGLYQPEGSYRFAVDSLLLASFISFRGKARLLDIGSGCGVVALAALCARPDAEAFAVEREEKLVAAARKNAEALGFARQFRIVQADIACPELFTSGHGLENAAGLAASSFDVALANPPFRRADRGRTPTSPLRKRALFEEENTLELFCRCAARALKPEGSFGIVHDAAREGFLLERLEQAGMAPVRLLPVRALPDREPFRILVEARPWRRGTAFPVLRRQDPLTLCGHDGKPSARAAAFCPFLSA